MTSMAAPAGGLHRPTDRELAYILLGKIVLLHEGPRIPVLNIYDYEPHELPQLGAQSDDQEWCFLCPRQGERANRLTRNGYWKVTGDERTIKDGREEIGTKRILVFHSGRTPRGSPTKWKMHQYSASPNYLLNQQEGTFVLCKIVYRSKSNSSDHLVDQLGSNLMAADAYQMPAYPSFDHVTSSQFVMSGNEARDVGNALQVGAELAPYPLPVQYDWVQNPSFVSASEWQIIGSYQLPSEPESDQ